MEYKPIVETQMLIRRPSAEVFNAFIDPEITTRFWFTRSNGKLEEGKTITWHWEMYGVSDEVQVKEIKPNQKISITWGNPVSTVDFLFEEMPAHSTYVTIKNYDLPYDGEQLIEQIKDLTGGFTTVLDGAKAWLEHHIKLHLIEDKFPHRRLLGK